MTDFVSITVAVVIIFMVFRWLSGDASQPSRHGQTRRAPARHVSPEMVDTVKSMFPHIPTAAIHYDLQKTGSVELTCENVLRDGTLPMPPSPRPATPPVSGSTIGRNAGVGSSTGGAAAGSSSSATASGSYTSSPNANLLNRYGLQDQASRNYVPDEPSKVWADTAEKRQQIFKNRKEFMILQARKKMLEEQERKKKQQEENEKAKTPSATNASVSASEPIQA